MNRVASFRPLGPAHLAVLAAVPACAAALSAVARGSPARARGVRTALAAALVVEEMALYVSGLRAGWLRPPHGLPLDLCDVLVWVAVVALLSERAFPRELLWFLGVAGTGMALLTPDVGGAWPSFAAVDFFVRHGLVVAAALFLAWSGAFRPRPGAWWRVFLALNAYAAAVLAFDLATGTNYMYLRHKPRAGTLLDLLGPWPWYLAAAEPVALALLVLLALPFRRRAVR